MKVDSQSERVVYANNSIMMLNSVHLPSKMYPAQA